MAARVWRDRSAPLDGPAVALLVVLALVPRAVVVWDLPLAGAPDQVECAPDEGLQYWTVMRYAGGDFATWPASGSIYSAFPPVPYAPHAVALALARALPGDAWPARFPSTWWRLRRYGAARLGGVLLGVATVLAAAALAATCTRSRRLALASGTAVAWWPQLVFVNGYVNADAFTIAAVAVLALAVARWARHGEGREGVVAVGAAVGLVALGKPNGFAALVPTVLWLADAFRRRRLARVGAAHATAAAALVALPVFAVNALRNGGDPLGLAKYRELVGSTYQGVPLREGFGEFLAALARSSFGVFRHADLALPAPFYALALGFVVAGCGAGLALPLRGSASANAVRAVTWVGASVMVSIGLVVANGALVDAQAQGRYLLPALVPLVVAVTCALGAFPSAHGRALGIGTALLAAWLAFLAAATATGLALIHVHPCI